MTTNHPSNPGDTRLSQQPNDPSRVRKPGRRIGATALGGLLLLVLVARGWSYLRSDREFDSGSRIEAQLLSPIQVDNLVLLGKVWGLAKYHHPKVTAGQVQWDYELFRIMPAMLRAGDRESATLELVTWLQSFGEVSPCDECVSFRRELQLAPDNDWIRDSAGHGAELRDLLVRIQGTRPRKQHYVSHHWATNHPQFPNERRYDHLPSLDAGYRLLALFRFWNVVEYWFPYRDIIAEDWDDVLKEYIPRLMNADSAGSYRRETASLQARVKDGHALVLREGIPPAGRAEIPIRVRFVEDQAVVTGFTDDIRGRATGLLVGDVLLRIGGDPVDTLVARWLPYYAASTDAARLRSFASALTRGPREEVRIEVQRANDTIDFALTRTLPARGRPPLTRDRPGPAFQMLTDEVAYIKLSTVERRDIDSYLRQAAAAKVLVIDIRNYPVWVVDLLGGRLVTEPTEYARVTHGLPELPGGFVWTEPLVLAPRGPPFSRKVVVLVDEGTQSRAETTAMALRAAPNTVLVGSPTAGANGNVSLVPLPGVRDAMFSGVGMFYADGNQTQRIGIIPDVVVYPTIAGIRDGRDEVLEAGVSYVLGREFRERSSQELR
jgi:C-terminal processing protease CtpA/Prc